LETPLAFLDLEAIGSLSFRKPDPKKFRCLDLARSAAETGGSMPAVLNGANEIAVDLFLKRKIEFFQIPEVIEKTMEAHKPFRLDGIESVLEVDRWAREKAMAFI
jgi:1-deoxy-D-xylulose-5-phosphate reductoisomerase